jgi:uncharacterized membrane protein YagU involved in acid resistance
MILLLKKLKRQGDQTQTFLKSLSWIFTLTYAARSIVLFLKAIIIPHDLATRPGDYDYFLIKNPFYQRLSTLLAKMVWDLPAIISQVVMNYKLLQTIKTKEANDEFLQK